jgi:hypothetical protein
MHTGRPVHRKIDPAPPQGETSVAMVIVFDTGPFTADRSMNKPVSRALLTECQEERIRVVIPRVVLEEVISATAGYLRNVEKNLNSARHNLGETFVNPPELPTVDVEKLVDAYRDEIEETLLDHNVEIVEWHAVSHDDVVERDLARKPPFDDSGRGYRDTLTWHVVRDLVLDHDERVILITRDHDFSVSEDDQNTLHPELVKEIGGDSEAIMIVPDIATAMRRVGDARQDLRQSLTATLDERSSEIAFEALTFLGELFPYGLDGEVASGKLLEVAVEDVVEAWGVLSAVARAELSFEYAGTLNEAEYDYYLETVTPADQWVADDDWNDEQRYASIWGSGVVDVVFEITAEREGE